MSFKSTTTLFAPKVKYASTNESQYDAMSTWRAELELGHFDADDTPQVLAGYADFLIINAGEHPIADLLDSLSQDAEHFAELFDGDYVSYAVQDQFEDVPFNRILIITVVDVAAPLRGHDLGAWLVAELIARMSSPTDTLVLLYPHPVGPQSDPASERAAVTALRRHWQRVGLEPIEDAPHFLGQATAYLHLPNARVALNDAVEHVEINVPTALITNAPAPYPRDTIADQPLRLVRNDG